MKNYIYRQYLGNIYSLVITTSLLILLMSTTLLTGCSGSSSGSIGSDAPPTDSPKLLSITPLTKTVTLGGTLNFEASGGAEPYSFDVYYGNGSITNVGATGTYHAAMAEGTAVVRAQDASGNAGYATVEITDAPVIEPTSKTLAITNKFPFAVLSGKAPYTFAVMSGEGAINATTGLFTAGNNAGAVVIRVTDAGGRTADANVTVNTALSFINKNIYVEKTSTYTLAATGGVAPYSYYIASGAGSVDKTTGVYTAPSALGVATIYVFDSLGNVDLAVLNITTVLGISPTSALVAKNSNLSFSATGGVPPYSYAVQTGSVGTVSALTGVYTAPAGTGSATVRVTDSLGHTSDASVTITNNLSFSVANLILAVGNTFDISTIVNGGLAPLTYSVPSSQGVFAGSTYTAPNTPGVYTITVSDSQAPTPNTVTTIVTVNSALILLPASSTMAVGAQKSFSASGGVPPYTYIVQSGGGSITNGLFTAPDVNGSAVILVTDARGNTATATVTVQAALAIVPATKTLSSGEGFTFTATGGNAPYSFSLVSGSGAINSSTGLYTAPGSSGLATVRVEDAAGNRQDALITILNPLYISPPTISLIKNASITFTASGGAGPYAFSVASGDGSVNATTGVFTASATAGVNTVRVTDSLGSIKDATVTIYDGLSISPFTKSLAVNQTFTFTANGGLAPYTYSLVSGVGSIASSGAYSASAAGAAVVRVTDSSGNTSDASITVNSALVINPTSKTLGVNNQFTFSASGGVPPYAFSVLSGGGTITTAGDYKAPTASANVVVRVTDTESSTADANITVNDALTISPTNATIAAGGTQSFITAGGVGPYVYSVVSGGGSFASSTYTAASIASGASINAVVTDVLGNTANASISINPITVAISSPNNSDLITASNKASFTVSGTCSESGQVVNVSTTDGVTATPNCAAGVWSTNLNLTAVTDGSVTITATHANVNAVAATPATVTLTKDGSNPTVTITTPADGSYVSASLTVTGTCTKQGPISITVTGGITANTTCESNGYSKNIDLTSVADGALTITVAHTDTAGNAATPATVSVTKDSITPTITAFTVTNTSPTNSTTYNLTFTASDSPTQYCILENSIIVASCSWQNVPLPTSFAVSSTNNDKTLSAWVRDAAGNTSARVDSNMVHLDNVAPTIAIAVPTASTYINAASSVSAYTVSGTCNKEGGTVTVKAGSTSVGTASCTLNAWTVSANFTSIADGSISLTAVLTDLTATNTTSSAVSITKDVIVPTVSAFSITNANPSSSTTYNLTFTATDTPSNYCILENSTTIGNCTWTSTPVPTSFTVNTTQNAKVLSAWVKDLAGNISIRADSNSVILNTATPDAPSALSLSTPSTSPNNVTTPIIQVAGVSVGDTVSIYTDSSCIGGNLKGSATVTTGTSVTVTSSVLTDNTYIFYAKTVNSASTASSCSTANVSYTLDTAAPTAGTISVNAGAAYATSATVPLTLGATGASQMYITNTSGCASGGTYETYATTKASWTLATTNATNTVYAKFKDVVGNESFCVSDNILHDNTGPDAPTALSLGSVPNSDITTPTLSWTAAADNAGGSGIQFYQVQIYKTSDNSIVTGGSWSASSSGSAITGSAGMLVGGTSYYMQVRAIDYAGNLGTASANSANWTAVTTTVPDAPTIGTATAGAAQATVAFTAPASDGGAAITSYTVTSNPGGITASGSASPITVTGLTNGTAYTFTVVATNSAGNSAASAASNSVTPYFTTYAKWNAADKAAVITLSNGSLSSTSTSGWGSVRSTISKSSGKWYWEITCSTAPTGYVFIGIANSTMLIANGNYLGGSAQATSYYGLDGQKYNNGAFAYGATYTNQVIGVALDASNGTITFYKNNVSQGQITSVVTGPYYAAISNYSTDVCTANFGATALTYTPPSGYNAGLYIYDFSPNAPTIGAATLGAFSGQATVAFTTPADNGGSPITSYTVTSNPGGITASGSASPITVSGLTVGTPYTFTVVATNSVGNSVASAASNSVTPILAYATWNSADKSAVITLSNGSLTSTNIGSVWGSVRSTTYRSSDKWYWEVTCTSSSGLMIGIANSSMPITNYTGAAGGGTTAFGYYNASGIWYNGGSSAYGTTYTTEVIGVALDASTGYVTFYKNNVSQGQVTSAVPGPYYAVISHHLGANSCTTNFGATAFTYTPPTGYNAGFY